MLNRLKERRLAVSAAGLLLVLVLAAIGLPLEDVCNAAMEMK